MDINSEKVNVLVTARDMNLQLGGSITLHKDKLLTISIAAYNVEEYLEQTLDSLNDKRYLDEIEVLIIDDGSKDNTKRIALKYQELEPDTFRYIYKENGGHGSTINKGIEHAQGKYFRVIDGDDWVAPDDFAKYVKKLKEASADMVLTQNIIVCGDRVTKDCYIGNLDEDKLYSWNNQPDLQMITMHMITIRTELLRNNHVRITEKCFYVDIEFVIWAIYLSETIEVWNLYVYMYRAGNVNQSMSKQNLRKNIIMQEAIACKLTETYVHFKARNDLTGAKENLILNRITKSIRSVYLTYLSFDQIVVAKKGIIAFDDRIKNISNEVYDILEKELFFRAIRVGKYALLPIIKFAYKVYGIMRH